MTLATLFSLYKTQRSHVAAGGSVDGSVCCVLACLAATEDPFNFR